MRHVMSPLDFSVEELDKLLTLANDIERTLKNMPMPATEKNLLLCFMSQVPVPV